MINSKYNAPCQYPYLFSQLYLLARKKGVHQIEKNHDPGSGTLHTNIDQAGLDPVVADDRLHLIRDVVETVMSGGGYVGAPWMIFNLI